MHTYIYICGKHQGWRPKIMDPIPAFYFKRPILLGIPADAMVKSLSPNVGYTEDVGSTPGSGRFPGGRNGNPRQDTCLENPMDRGAWQSTVHGAVKSQTRFLQQDN